MEFTYGKGKIKTTKGKLGENEEVGRNKNRD